MIEEICRWLPKIITLNDFEGNWEKYNSRLYEIFLNDFVKKDLFFNNKRVQIRAFPKYNNYEHAFIHLTCTFMKNGKEINDREPDIRRCERISWNRKIIENYNCENNCKNCRKIMYYEEYYNNKIRINLLFADVKFKVVLEKREKYYLLITGYYINYEYRLNKEIQKANLFSQQKTPLD